MLNRVFSPKNPLSSNKMNKGSTVVGHVDSYDRGEVKGWVYNNSAQDENCTVVIYHKNQLLARAIANIGRPDVLQAGHSTANCGFSISIPKIFGRAIPEVRVYEEKTGVELKGSPISSANTASTNHIFDLSDLVYYLAHHDNPSGIQRVVLSTISSLIELDEKKDHEVRFAYFNNESLNFREIPYSSFLQLLSDLKASIGDRVLPIGRGDVDNLLKALGASSQPIASGPNSTIVMLGAAWVFPEYFTAVRNHKQKGGKFCCLIHDLIPIKMPSMCDKGTAEIFKFFIRRVCLFADVIFTVSAYTAKDLEEFITKQRLPHREIIVLQNGDGFSGDDITANVPDYSLPQQPYVLYVSTIEGRKNHRILLDVWQTLRAESVDVPQLVFVGRVGWRVESLIEQMHESNMLDGKLRIMSNVTDAQLFDLYKNCLFTVYPSLYEGWGLPVSESLSLGKVCVASNRTSIPEVARGAAILFDPDNAEELLAIVKDLCTKKGKLQEQEASLRQKFTPITWNDVATRLIVGLNRAAELTPDNIFTADLNTEYTFRTLTYLDSNVAHGHEVDRHARSFSSPILTDRPIGIDNYIKSDLLMGGTGWYRRENWGRWSKFNTDNRLLFRISHDDAVIVYIKAIINSQIVPANITASVNGRTNKIFSCGKEDLLLAVPARGPVIDIELNISGEAPKLDGDTRMLGIGYKSLIVVKRNDLEERMNILEVSALQ
ncbi:glycosyltransferase family 1 protein [Methylobacterium sp. yr668]|uniref:glycosyltransferase family 4 protein n=1 Tax=Methylobacterium sp. yr668 TaxID=1761801 RepID=UPI0008EEF018|nr:glycosyltransferase family 1 protein [Methylobacterium sp. yr668]SFT26373.1 Glycosyltransferase involved in cell wall bisynthesis [Methylobacterium sp. yr668]